MKSVSVQIDEGVASTVFNHFGSAPAFVSWTRHECGIHDTQCDQHHAHERVIRSRRWTTRSSTP